MTQKIGVGVVEIDPETAWKTLKEDPKAVLVDVRTKAEWQFVGIPDLSPLGKEVTLAEWQSYPSMAVSDRFADDLLDGFGADTPSQVLFICRSGARSLAAARQTADAAETRGLTVRCINVAEGFEGDRNAEGHRGTVGGWKARGLTWHQN